MMWLFQSSALQAMSPRVSLENISRSKWEQRYPHVDGLPLWPCGRVLSLSGEHAASRLRGTTFLLQRERARGAVPRLPCAGPACSCTFPDGDMVVSLCQADTCGRYVVVTSSLGARHPGAGEATLVQGSHCGFRTQRSRAVRTPRPEMRLLRGSGPE